VATGIDTVENAARLDESDRGLPVRRPERRIGDVPPVHPSRVLAMTQAIRDGLAAQEEIDEEEDLDAATPEPAPQPRPAARPVVRPLASQRIAPRPVARPGREAPVAAAAVTEPDNVEPAEEACEDTPHDSDFAQHVKATIKGGMGVFDRMMAGVKSARQANRAAQAGRRAPVMQRPAAARPIAPTERRDERPLREPVNANDSLLPIEDDEEQLEIPAFLRRQAN
jgi:hypothetical protein